MNTKLISRFDISVVALALMAMSGHTSAAADYKYTDLGQGTAYSINNNGQIVGTDGRAVLWNGDTKMVLSNGSGTAYDINSIGQVVGISGFRAVLWDDASSTILPLRSANDNSSAAYAINDAGKIVGYAAQECCPVDPVLWENANTPAMGFGYSRGSAEDINNAGQIIGNTTFGSFLLDGARRNSFDFSVYGINNKGQVVGSDGNNAMYWIRGNSPTPLDTLGGYAHALANGNNDGGSIIGLSYNAFSDHTSHATYWGPDSTAAIDLNSFLPESVRNEGWVLVNAQAINDSGAIVGNAYNSSLSIQHAFVLTPIPEPETYVLLLTGLGMICFLRYRRGSGYSFR